MDRLTTQEQSLPVERLRGQQSRGPITDTPLGGASLADGCQFDAGFLRSARGCSKLVEAPLPPSAYEIDALNTGILEIPAVEGYEDAWTHDASGGARGWCEAFSYRFIGLGTLTDDSTADGAIFFATATEIGTTPNAATVDSIRMGLVVAAGKYTIRLKWGVTSLDIPFEDSSTNEPFDPLRWTRFVVEAVFGGVATSIIRVTCYQIAEDGTSLGISAGNEIEEAKGWIVHQFWHGGAMADRRPFFGFKTPAHGAITEVLLRASTVATVTPFGGTDFETRTAFTVVGTATDLTDGWMLDGTVVKPLSAGGREGRLVGNTVHRSEGITPEQDGSLDFDGTGMVVVYDARRLREPPKSTADGGVPGHLLELPERTIALLVDPRGIPWRHASVERACFLCESTPYATNLGGGVAGDPMTGTWPDNIRPSEHLRCEIVRDTTTWLLRVYFGELEPVSLKHPAGTPGGSSSTSWPPALSTAGEPSCTWNMPQGDPTDLYSDPDGTRAFEIELGDDTDPTHPMAYAYWVFLQRKFVAQGSASNACGVYVWRVLDGVLDDVTGEMDDANADANGERHPANQSCYTAARLNASDLNFRADNYLFTLGAAGGSRFGDEQFGMDGSTKPPMCYPSDGIGQPVFMADTAESFPAVVRIASFGAFAKYLLPNDREKIVTAGAFTDSIRGQFERDLICSYNFDEGIGNTLRDARGGDIGYAQKLGVVRVENDEEIVTPASLGGFPRPHPAWCTEAPLFENEYSGVTGIVQRVGPNQTEEIFVTSRAGLYVYDRDERTMTRLATIPGLATDRPMSMVLDGADNLHIAGGPGRPIVMTRERVVAISGIDPPLYNRPQEVISSSKSISGGISVTFQSKTDANVANLVGYEIADGDICAISIGYWSDILRARSRPGPVILVRYSPGVATLTKYRVLIDGLPLPKGPNANLITHFEIYRSESGATQVLNLEKRIPVSQNNLSVLVGDQVQLGEEANFFRDVPPEGMKALAVWGDRLIGVAPPEFPREVRWTVRNDPTNWPPIYAIALKQTTAPAAGVVVRRDRCFAFQRDYLYQMIDSYLDTDATGRVVDAVKVFPDIEGCGGLSHFAVVNDHDHGFYLAGNKTIYLTEGGTFRSLSIEVDSTLEPVGDSWTWPLAWDISDPDLFVGAHDERRRSIFICGPSADDPERRDAIVINYEETSATDDGRLTPRPSISRIKGLGMTCSAKVLDQSTGENEVWFGTDLGYIMRLDASLSMGVDYAGRDPIDPKFGKVMAVLSTTELRLEASVADWPRSDAFRGALLRLYDADGEMTLATRVIRSSVALSWVDVTLAVEHGVAAGATTLPDWTIGAIPMTWLSGKFGAVLRDQRLQSADVRMQE